MMKDLLEKVSSYNIFNYLLPGTVFVAISKHVTKYNFDHDNIVLNIFLYYFIGLVISRIGSLMIEPFLKWVRFLEFSEYRDYMEAFQKDKLIEVLSEENNMYRTFCSLFLCLFLLKLTERLTSNFPFANGWLPWLAIAFLLTIFVLSYRKQTNYITKRISNNKKGEDHG